MMTTTDWFVIIFLPSMVLLYVVGRILLMKYLVKR